MSDDETPLASDPLYGRDYGWTMADFQNSFNHRLSTSHVKIGLIPYLEVRSISARLQLDPLSVPDLTDRSNCVGIYPIPASDFLVVKQEQTEPEYELSGCDGVLILT